MAIPVPPRAPKPASRKKREHSRLLREFEQDGTLQSPSITLCIELVSKLFYRHILFRDGSPGSRRNMEWEYKFDIDNFLSRKYNIVMPFNPISVCAAPYVIKQSKQRSQCYRPSLSHIIKFVTQIFNKLHLNVESSIVSLIYTERLMDKLHISLTSRNWRPIVIAGILTSTKVWDDLSAWNVEFSNLLPMLSLQAINKLEGIYLTALDYDLYISSSEYAKYYFALRGLKNVKCQKIPRYYLDMKITPLSNNNNNNNSNNNNSTSKNSLNSKFNFFKKNRNNKNKNNNNNHQSARMGNKNLNNVNVGININGNDLEEEKYNHNNDIDNLNNLNNLNNMNIIQHDDERPESLLSDGMGHSLIGATAHASDNHNTTTNNNSNSSGNRDRLQRSLHQGIAADEDSAEYQSLRSEYNDNTSRLSFVSDYNDNNNNENNNNNNNNSILSDKHHGKLTSVHEEFDQKRKSRTRSQKIQIRKPKPNTANAPLLMPLSMPGEKAMQQLKNENRPRM